MANASTGQPRRSGCTSLGAGVKLEHLVEGCPTGIEGAVVAQTSIGRFVDVEQRGTAWQTG